jgi:hypothetical protein
MVPRRPPRGGPVTAARRVLRGAGIWAATIGLAALLVVLLGAAGVASGQDALHPGAKPAPKDINVTASDFRNLATMTRVRGFFISNPLGHLKQALKVANSPKGGAYPVGTIIQLVPQEAMVKRRKGFSRVSHDWEFFFLQTTAQGTTILNRGTTAVVNRFGGNCLSCHSAAAPQFDFVCEHTHGCAPLPVGDDVIAAVQRADPRPLTPPPTG